MLLNACPHAVHFLLDVMHCGLQQCTQICSLIVQLKWDFLCTYFPQQLFHMLQYSIQDMSTWLTKI